MSKWSSLTRVQEGCWSYQKFFSVFTHKSEQKEEWFHFSHIIIANNRNPDLEFVFAFQEHPWVVCGDQRKMLINTTINENKHRLKFQAPWLLLKASRDSSRRNKAEIHFGCQGIVFPTADPSLGEGNIPPISEQPVTLKLSHVWKAISEMQQTWMLSRAAKVLISSADLHGTWILSMCMFVGFFHLHIYLIDLTKGITGLKENE